MCSDLISMCNCQFLQELVGPKSAYKAYTRFPFNNVLFLLSTYSNKDHTFNATYYLIKLSTGVKLLTGYTYLIIGLVRAVIIGLSY